MLIGMLFKQPVRIALLLLAGTLVACGTNDNAHTTSTTIVPAPPRQVLSTARRPSAKVTAKPTAELRVDPTKPFVIFNLIEPNKPAESDEVVIDFALANAQLKGDGGEYRVRYIVDDEDMQWIDRWEQTVLTGWTAGEHTIRLELIGPDDWPFYNGNTNVVTKKIIVPPKPK
jgi:hypothetical protein